MKKLIVLVLAASMLLGLAACGAPAAEEKTVDLKALYETMTGETTEMMLVEGDTRSDFMGIQEEDCTQVITAFAADGLLTDEIWLIEAASQEALDRIADLAEKRMAAKAEETVSYSPEQYAVVEKGVILKHGLYLAFLVCPQVDSLKAQFEAAFQ